MGRLTTHVLDTAHGCPGNGIMIRLYRQGGVAPLLETCTNADGRCDDPLLAGEALVRGQYVLSFEIAAYFRSKGVLLSDPPFIDVVRIAFGIADTSAHYHVPLLVSPFSYSTYRGS